MFYLVGKLKQGNIVPLHFNYFSFGLSSANLSCDYFVNRQDRYVLFKDSKELADFFADTVHTTLAHSYTLNAEGSTNIPSAFSVDPLSSRKAARVFKSSLCKAIRNLFTPSPKKTPSQFEEHSSEFDTIVYPLVQIGFCGVRQDETVTERLLSSSKGGDSIYLASGYFNLPPTYSKAILQSKGTFNILAASPQVRGRSHTLVVWLVWLLLGENFIYTHHTCVYLPYQLLHLCYKQE